MGARLVIDWQNAEGRTEARVYDHWAADNEECAKRVLKAFFEATNRTDPAAYITWRALHYCDKSPFDFSSIYLLPTNIPRDQCGGEYYVSIVDGLPNYHGEQKRPKVLSEDGRELDIDGAGEYGYDSREKMQAITEAIKPFSYDSPTTRGRQTP